MSESIGAPRVFISHHSADTWVAQQIADHVHRLGGRTFLDCIDIRHGDDFWSVIRTQAVQCTEILVLLTPASIERFNIWVEVGIFFGTGKRITGVLYGVDVKVFVSDERIPIFIKSLDLLNINGIQSYFDQLSERISSTT